MDCITMACDSMMNIKRGRISVNIYIPYCNSMCKLCNVYGENLVCTKVKTTEIVTLFPLSTPRLYHHLSRLNFIFYIMLLCLKCFNSKTKIEANNCSIRLISMFHQTIINLIYFKALSLLYRCSYISVLHCKLMNSHKCQWHTVRPMFALLSHYRSSL